MEQHPATSSLLNEVRHVLTLAAAGACAGAVCLAIAVAWHPAVVWEADADLPRATASGFYPAERAGSETFAWTGPSATFRLSGVDRHVEWQCSARLRVGRPPGAPHPSAALGIDGLVLATQQATNDYQEMRVVAPPRTSPGLTLTIASSSAFVPGGSDTRQLGLQVDRIACESAGGWVRPPIRAWTAASVATAIFGVTLALLGVGLVPGVVVLVLLGAAQAVPLATGPAAYMPYAGTPLILARAIVMPLLVVIALMRGRQWRPIGLASRSVLAFSSMTLFLQLLALLHPYKPAVDAVFHAHRLDAVLAGHYYFTQPMPSGVQFPYAIALYLFAAPWARLVTDHVLLLRVIVSCCHVLAGLLLYPIVVRHWNNRPAAVIAVLLYQWAPLPYIVQGNANLTYMFGQSFAVFAVAAAVLWQFGAWRLPQAGGLFLLASVAFLSHVGVFPLLLTALVVFALSCWWSGADQRRPAVYILAAALLAAAFSIAAYYAHFPEAYSTLQRVRTRAAIMEPGSAGSGAGAPQAEPARGLRLTQRVARAAELLSQDAGWPVLALAVVGAWRTWRTRERERLRLWLLSAAMTYLAFVVFAVTVPVEPRFQRYTDEFVSRLDFATLPAIVVTAGLGSAWALARDTVLRVCALVLIGAAAWGGVQHWLQWFR